MADTIMADILADTSCHHSFSFFSFFNITNLVVYLFGICCLITRSSVGTPISGILTGKNYVKQYPTNLVLILYICNLNI